jgi:hypothetical protein
MSRKKKISKKVVLALVLLTLMGVVAYAVSEAVNPASETYSWRYKMTIEIDTPEGVKSGSAVREVTVEFLPNMYNPDEPKRKSIIKGEAVAVDLGERGVLFALLKGINGSHDHAKLITSWMFPKPAGVKRSSEYYSELKSEETTLGVEKYPMLVMFKDIKDPKSIVDLYKVTQIEAGYEVEDRFKELFGEGVKLRKISIEMTNEDVTNEINKKLIWLDKFKGNYLHGEFTSKGAPLGLYGVNFKQD